MITQKLNYLAFALLCAASVFADVDTDRSCRKKIICADTVKAKTICADELIVKTGCCACKTITAKDFMDADGNLSQTFVITEPGKYCLGENIDFAPADEGGFVAAIQILSSDVHLSLCDNTLKQANGVEDIYGVLIGYGYSVFFDDPNADPSAHFDNITVVSGSITNFTGCGVFCFNPTFDFLEEPFAFQSYIFTDLNVLDCGTSPSFNYFASGINLDSDAVDALFGEPSVEAYNNVIIDTCKVNRMLGNGSIGLHIGNNCVINNTQANDLSTDGEIDIHPDVGGVFNYNIICNNFQMFNCQGNDAKHLDLAPNNGQVGGLSLEICKNVYVKDCQFNDAFGEAVQIVNNNFSVCSNSVFENCQFNNARGGANAVDVCGVHMSDGGDQTVTAQGMRYINCQFNGARVADNNPGGIYDWNLFGFLALTLQDIIFENCQACNIMTENPGFGSFGYWIATDAVDPVFPVGNLQNLTFRNCIASDISGGADTVGFAVPATNESHTGNQGSLTNIVFENCIAERIASKSLVNPTAGIGEYSLFVPGAQQQTPRLANLLIRNCRVSDVRSGAGNLQSAGIFVKSVHNPVIMDNSVTDCDRGILLTGTNQVTPNGFQVAATLEDALAFPPVFIPLNVQLTLFTSEPGVGPFEACYTTNGPRLTTTPITAQGEIVQPNPPGDACDTVTNDLTDKIGIVLRSGACNSATFVLNTEAAGNPIAATLIIDNGVGICGYGGSPDQTQVAIAISQEDGQTLLDALEINPTMTLTINTIPSPETVQTFSNLARGNSVVVTPGNVDAQTDFIVTETSQFDFTAAGWQAGDPIFYDCNGFDAIPDLVCSTTYFAIVYRPGFAESGVIMNNEVDNCSVSGYQDDRELLDGTPLTSSAWVNNFAFNNGTPATRDTNYAIAWASLVPPMPPITAGTLAAYPTGAEKAYNISLIP